MTGLVMRDVNRQCRRLRPGLWKVVLWPARAGRMRPMMPSPSENRVVGKRQAWSPVHLAVLVCCAMVVLNGCGSQDQPTDRPMPNTNQINSGAPAALLPFNQVEYTYTQSPASFAALWSQARTRTVRIALLGDSQETSDRKSTRLNSSHIQKSRMPSSA